MKNVCSDAIKRLRVKKLVKSVFIEYCLYDKQGLCSASSQSI